MAFVAALPAVFSYISAAVSVIGTLASANAQANAASYNAKVASNNAKLAQQNSLMEEERHRALVRKQLGDMQAAYGASGIQMEGTPLDVLSSSAKNAELDALIIRHDGQVNAYGYKAEASLQNTRASNAIMGGVMGAGSALLSSAMSGASTGGSANA